jgi:hypothetical protein
MFSYYQIHPTSITKTNGAPSSEDRVTADIKSDTMSWSPRFTSTFLSGLKIIRKMRPRTPPNIIISSFLVLLATIEIITILAGIKCCHIFYSKNSTFTLSSEGATNIITASQGVVDCILPSSELDDDKLTASEHTTYSIKDFEWGIENPLGLFQGFTASLANGDSEKLNTQNTDSVFFVCDNSTTGHICNDIRKFIPGSLCQTNKSLTTANGTGPCLQEGTVWLHLNNDDGVKFIFILNNFLYHPDLPVNLLSTRQLAEKFINAHGNPDKQTRIELRYSTHVLTWSFGNYKKTFPTPLSGLPELLFDEVF